MISLVALALVTNAILAVTPPTLVAGPRDRVLVLNDETLLDCRVDGEPTPIVRWLKDNVSLTLDDESRFSLLPNGSLHVRNFQVEDQGVYHCTARSEAGRLRSANAFLLQSSYFGTASNTVVHSSEILTLSLSAEVDVNERSAAWTIRPFDAPLSERIVCPSSDCPGATFLTSTDRFRVTAVLRLVHDDLTRAFPSSDRFVVEGRVGSLPRRIVSANFNALEPRGLSIDLPPEDIAVEAGREATLYCISNAPDSTYQWFKDDSPIDLDSRRYRLVVDGVLTIADVEEADFGIYRCEVTGPGSFEGTRTSDALIDVYFRPDVSLRKTALGDVVVGVECVALGTAPFAVELTCDGVALAREPIERDDIRAEHTSERANVTKDAVCGCLVVGSFGSAYASQYVNIAEDTRSLKVTPSSTPTASPTSGKSVDRMTESSPSETVDLEESKNDSDGIFSQAPFIGLIAAVAALIVIVILLAVFILVKTRSRNDDSDSDSDDNASQRERQAGLTTADIGDPVPTEVFLRKKRPNVPAKSRSSTPESFAGSRNDLSGTRNGNDLVLYNARKQSNADLPPPPPPPPPPKPTAFKPISVTNEGYAVMEGDRRGSAATAAGGRVLLRPVAVRSMDSGEYARLEPLPPPPPVTESSSQSSASVPSGVGDDWHFLMNGKQYAVAEANRRRSPSPLPPPPPIDDSEERYAEVETATAGKRAPRPRAPSPVSYATVVPST